MVIDLILDRQDGQKYNPKQFYNDVMSYYSIFPEIIYPIASALDEGTENNVKSVLCSYIFDNGYNPKIIDYINDNNWL